VIEPKNYEFNPDVPIGVATKAGFTLVGNNLKYNKILYRYDDTSQPYVELKIWVENMSNTIVSVTCNGGDIYIPFYDPDARHDNLVYEKVVTNYHNEMEKLVRKKILKHVREHHAKFHHKEKKHHGNN